ncbi:MAG: glycosyltransferase family 2 protein [Hyphomicrobiaceae bacterium]|nr:glycosyltransferase family 2 protein [Hyphomicrobiaceae bacterium]
MTPAAGNLAGVSVIVPCLDEEEAIGPAVAAILACGVGEVIVVDGNSRDRTAAHAQAAGARVVSEARPGYGRALMTGIEALGEACDLVVFIDGDGSDRPEMIPALVAPLRAGTADFVLGTRLAGPREPGSLSAAQLLAGHLAGLLIRLAYGVRFTDMSPFRALRRDTLRALGMREQGFGWNLEMQMRAAASGLRCREVPVGQRCRQGGVSKVSGNLRVSVKVAWVLASTFLRLAATLRRERSQSGAPRGSGAAIVRGPRG